MKILHYVDENNLSWWRPWLQLIQYLQSRGVDNHILCRPGGTLSESAENAKIEVSTYKPVVSALPRLCTGISTLISDIKPDIIHTRLSSSAAIAGHWGEKRNIPVVSTIDKFPKGKYYRQCTKVIPCSSAIAGHMRDLGFSDDDMHLIFNPIDVDEYARDMHERENRRSKQGLENKDFIILGAGRFVDWKGFDNLLEACQILAQEKNVTFRWQLWLAGDGPERQKLESLVESDLHLKSKVKFLGFVKDIRPIMWASNLFVLPSHHEPFGLVLLEAMASGLPVLSTCTGGPLDIVTDDCGWFFDAGDIQGLAQMLGDILQRDDLRHYSDAVQKVSKKFSVETIGDQTIQFYKDVLEQSRPV